MRPPACRHQSARLFLSALLFLTSFCISRADENSAAKRDSKLRPKQYAKQEKADRAAIIKPQKLEKKLAKEAMRQLSGDQKTDSKDKRLKLRKLEKELSPPKEKRAPVAETSGENSTEVVNRRAYVPLNGRLSAKHDRLTIDLPAAYAELDTDADGQVGYYEWILVRRGELHVFDVIDTDHDGLLTPREISTFENANTQSKTPGAPESGYRRPRLLVIGGTWHLTAPGQNPTREQLPAEYNPARGRTDKERAKIHQDYVDRQLKTLSPEQRQRLAQLWKEKQKNDPDMPNRGAAFVRILDYVAKSPGK